MTELLTDTASHMIEAHWNIEQATAALRDSSPGHAALYLKRAHEAAVSLAAGRVAFVDQITAGARDPSQSLHVAELGQPKEPANA